MTELDRAKEARQRGLDDGWRLDEFREEQAIRD
jgi:hypothetical protein